MSKMLQFFILLPFLGLLAGLFVPHKKEKILSGIAIATVGLEALGILGFIVWWLANTAPLLDVKHLALYKSPKFEFFIDFYFDQTTAVFALVGAILTFLVMVFSRYYMHREQGFKRFFITLLLFYTGYNLIVFAGNFETLFVGWEILGITSFLLIAFYRDRYLPVKNGFKVLSFYRLGDICLILAMWMSHHLWHKNITFAEWNQSALVQETFQAHYFQAMFIVVMVLIAAAIKSAQLPFSTWLPRAMEGPTTSSAIFYGSLSVHIGAFLLLRTYPFWGHESVVSGVILLIGLTTSLVATTIAQVQSSVKTQIAYASIAQIGLIFIEIALGWHMLALLHFAGNAFLRTYQLLVSPSVLSYRIHDMFFNFSPRKSSKPNALFKSIQHAVYVLSVKEWNVDFLLHRFLWNPFKWIGRKAGFLGRRWVFATLLVLLALGASGFSLKENLHVHLHQPLTVLFSTLALLLVLKAFTAREDAQHAWLTALLSQFFSAISLLWNKDIVWYETGLYLSGSVLSAIVGYICLQRIQSEEGDISIQEYHGHSYEYPGIALVFLLACLGFSGFPITPTFIGIDLMFTHISANQIVLVVLTALNFLFLELTILRIYTRVFLGQHKKRYHPVAFKSS